MTSGSVEVAYEQSTHVIRLVGDVRLNLCSALETYVDDILRKGGFENIVIDLSAAEGVDSTTLGQLAKISILCREEFDITPTISSPNEGITRILLSMGFDQVFHIVDTEINDDATFRRWVVDSVDEECARDQVIDAHKVLMSLNDKNKETFRELVDTLEAGRR
ncbi:STAS domain-containing protein [Thalassolituus sp.]|jgi:anti-anti-sigma factor|uniref:STAS domain-containing protein n=1 Tax=Thalassolituus sp. TaxID=2030822 RepID=UPI002609B065|nr:STAS domain-containing protein [uncultured Thalassolituus sp.]TNC92500.1 MAG: anti-anti-sigma factor [Thalassolituus sp.]